MADALPPRPPTTYNVERNAPGDIYPHGAREIELCDNASHADWAYLAGLGLLDVGAIWAGSSQPIKYSGPYPSLTGPLMIGITWGATIGGSWLALPKCSPTWIGESPREGQVREDWPLALALALVAGATAPVVYGIAIGAYTLPQDWTDVDRGLHLAVAGVAAFGGAFLPYLIPPRTWSAARELDRIRVGYEGGRNLTVSYRTEF